MITAQALAACLLLASQTYQVPPAVMIGIMHVEGGRVGQQVGPNFNGTYDLGPMQVNTRWLPELARAWRVDVRKAHAVVRDDGCMNVKVAAWILHKKIEEAGSLYRGIAHYHSATPGHGIPYASKVVAAMERKGLIRYDLPSTRSRSTRYAQR
ncbi:MAG: lytic transglycosylase domain-containing protein [Alphaproteobacteria bacterium]|nr:lytic transglycosylase domain-containing protein [Alphaproteobacteria bacterium]